ncbi:MAG: EmmdR/YeeO family multidrug/toxin efflux MATE transporter [Treponemataceae bacterium]|nr:MAG: EmmdR/YeeO family multidrug/toxin efflux MATE transporter [Treponemataceae bacterium]
MTRIFSRQDLSRLIFPLIVEQFLVFSVGFADIVMAAHLGEAAVSGVSLVDNICVLITNLFAATAMGGAVVCSHYIGAGKPENVSLTAKQLIYTMLIISLFFLAIGLIFHSQILILVFGHIDDDVMRNAQTYFFFMLLSFPFLALYNASAALFRSQGNSRVSMSISIIANALNVGGNALCLFVLKMGVEGVAIPTLVSRTVGAAVLIFLLYHAKPYNGKSAIRIQGISKVKLDFKTIQRILAIGIPSGIENSTFQFGKIVVLSLVTSLGTGAIAANAAAGTMSVINTLSGSAISLALLTVVGQCLGAGRPDAAVFFTKKLMRTAYLSMGALNLVLLLTSKWQVAIFPLQPETSLITWRLYAAHCIAASLIWPLSFTLPNALRAANDAKFTMIASMLSMWFVRVGASYVFVLYCGMGIYGVWLGMLCDWIIRALIFTIRFLHGKWKMHYKITE